MPRPKSPLSEAERRRLHRARTGSRTIELPADTAAQLRAIRERDGDASDAAALRRVIEEAARG